MGKTKNHSKFIFQTDSISRYNYRGFSVGHTFTKATWVNSEKATGVFSVTISASQCKQLLLLCPLTIPEGKAQLGKTNVLDPQVRSTTKDKTLGNSLDRHFTKGLPRKTSPPGS